ncbi:MAG: hypothetical protein WAX11_01490, partial [Gemmiger qucibialis]
LMAARPARRSWRCARFLYDDEEENVLKGKKGKILPRTEKEICRGRCLHRPVGRAVTWAGGTIL